MVSYRSRRIEQLHGGRVDALTYADLQNLVTNKIREQFDVEYKKQHYGNGDSERRNLCGDVAALANTAGGVLILGIDEDHHAQAKEVVGVAIDDAQIRRILQIVAAGVSPVPMFDIHPVSDPDPGHQGRGVLVVAVSRSVRQPHAVLVDEKLRYPKRHGTTIDYLSEPEVAEAYRERFLRIGQAHTLAAARVDSVTSMLPNDDPERYPPVPVTLPWATLDGDPHTMRLCLTTPERIALFRT